MQMLIMAIRPEDRRIPDPKDLRLGSWAQVEETLQKTELGALPTKTAADILKEYFGSWRAALKFVEDGDPGRAGSLLALTCDRSAEKESVRLRVQRLLSEHLNALGADIEHEPVTSAK